MRRFLHLSLKLWYDDAITSHTMLDIKFIRENKDLIKEGARKKHINFDVEALLAVDNTRREVLLNVEKKRAEQNAASQKITKQLHQKLARHSFRKCSQ